MSHSVRTPDECVEVHDSNTELNISLLDQRFLSGDRVLYAGLADRLPRFIHANRDALVRNLASLTRDRHTKYTGTFYHLGPNVKDTPGGLRDYQLVCWLGQLRDGAADPSPELREAYHFLARLRCYLHIQTGRDNNLLTFDARDAFYLECCWSSLLIPDISHVPQRTPSPACGGGLGWGLFTWEKCESE